MNKNLKILISSSLIALSFSVVPVHYSYAATAAEDQSSAKPKPKVTVFLPNGEAITLALEDLKKPLSSLRSHPVLQAEEIEDDLFQYGESGGRIAKLQENEFTIEEILYGNGTIKTLSFLKRAASSGSLPEDLKPDAKKHAQEAKFTLQAQSLDPGESPLGKGTGTAKTAEMSHYQDLSPEQRKALHERLCLMNGMKLTLEGLNRSFRPSVTWETEPDFKIPDGTASGEGHYSISRSMREIRKSSSGKYSGGLSFLGFGVDSEYQTNQESLKRKQKTKIYLFRVDRVPKIELSIRLEHVKVSSELGNKIREAIQTQGKPLENLIEVFKEWGFCVPTKFVLGGSQNFEEEKEVQSEEIANSDSTQFSAAVGAFLNGLSAKARGAQTSAISEVNATASMNHKIRYTVTGGDPGLKNNVEEWTASLGLYEKWGVIDCGDFIPIIDFLDTGLRDQCRQVMSQYWTGHWVRDLENRNISLPALQMVLQKIEQPRRIYNLTPPEEIIYQRFLRGVLIYKKDQPDEAKLPIANLAKPVEGTFDLSGCGETGNYIEVHTGHYTEDRKKQIREDRIRRKSRPQPEGGNPNINVKHVDIWLSPRFLIEKNLASVTHFSSIMDHWDRENAPVGLFWTWSEWDNLSWFDYLTSVSMEAMGTDSLPVKYEKAWQSPTGRGWTELPSTRAMCAACALRIGAPWRFTFHL